MTFPSILDNRLFIRLDLDHPLRANSFFQSETANLAHFASQLLLYDVIIIPSTDFGIVPTFNKLARYQGFRRLWRIQ